MSTNTLTGLLNESLIENSAELAVCGDNHLWTYLDIDKLSKLAVCYLQRLGIGKGDKIIVLTGNSVWSVIALLSTIRIGAVEIALHPSDAFVRILRIIEEVKPKTIIVGDYELKERIEKEKILIPTAILSLDKVSQFEDDLPKFAKAQISPNDIALIQYTSGSTGKPKGAIFSHGAIATVLCGADYLSSLYRKRLLLGIPLAHAYGKTCLIEYLIAGAQIFIEKAFLLPRQITDLLMQKEIQAIEGPPTLYEIICKDASFNTISLPSLCYIAMNAAKPRKDLLLDIRKRFPQAEIVVRYGISEIAGPISRLVWRKAKSIPLNSCGIPASFVNIDLVDEDGRKAEEGKQGEIVVHSPGRMNGYLDETKKNASKKQKFKTGDIGCFDSKGYLYLLGRKNFMIKSGGHRIFPKEIEDVITTVSGVAECAVGGIPDDLLGEKICAWIVLKKDTEEDATRQQIVTVCRNKLQSVKVPHLIVFKRELPKTMSNKVKIAELINKVLRGKLRVSDIRNKKLNQAKNREKETVNIPRLYDNTMRDGEQTVGVSFSMKDKVTIATRLVKAGITHFEAGFAVVSDEERRTIRSIVEKNITQYVFSLARLTKEDVDEAIEAGVKHVTLFIPSSDPMIQARLNCSEQEIENRISQVVDYAKKLELFVKFSCEDATRTPLERLVKFYTIAREFGADYISLPDTTGIGTPEHITGLVKTLKQEVKLPISFHGHNDLGLAVANSIAAVKAGADEIQITVNGLGERAGNTPMDEFVLATKVGYGIDLDIDLIEMVELSRLLTEITGIELASNKPIVGKNSFCHESGIHVQALLKEDLGTYEPFPPEWIGRKHEVAFGKHSGRSNIRFLCRQVGLSLNPEEENEVFERIKSLSQTRGYGIERGEVLEIILESRRNKILNKVRT